MKITADIPAIETERLILRRPLRADLPQFLDFITSARASFVGGPMDAARGWRTFATIIGHWELCGFGLFVACLRKTGRPVGTVGLLRPEGWPEGEIAWHIWDAGDEGRGYATEAATAVRHHAFTHLNWPSAVSYIASDNLRSRALAERLGARLDPVAQNPFAEQGAQVYRHPKEVA